MTDEPRMETTPGGSTPVPDPTKLTDAAIAKAEKAIHDWVEGQLDVLRGRFDGMDTATDLRLRDVDKVPGVIDSKIKCLEDVVSEKFVNVTNEFAALKERMAEQKSDTQNAVTAAFAASDRAVALQTEASEKSIAKSEGTTIKQLDAQAAQSATAIDALKDRITGIELAVERIIANRIGVAEQRVETRAQTTDNRALFGILIALGGLFLTAVVVLAAVLASRG